MRSKNLIFGKGIGGYSAHGRLCLDVAILARAENNRLQKVVVNIFIVGQMRFPGNSLILSVYRRIDRNSLILLFLAESM